MTTTRFTILFLFALTIGATGEAAAQNRIQVVDADDGVPLPYATVRFTFARTSGADSTVVLSVNGQGIAPIPFALKEGPIVVTAESLGYIKTIDTIGRDGERTPNRLYTIKLTPNSLQTDEVVVTGQYGPTGSDRSLYQVRTISQDEINKRAAQDLRDLMSSELNVRLSQDNILGSSMSIQGVSGQNVKVLIDGLPVVGRVGGEIDLSQIPLQNIERVEVVEGPLSVAYGTDALGGVVNLITDKKLPPGPTVEASLYHESVGTWNADARFGFLFDNTRLMLGGGRHFFGGFARPDTSRSKRWKPREQYFLNWDGTFYAGKFSFAYSGQFFNEYILNRGLPRAPYGESAFDDTYRTNRLTNRLLVRGNIGKDQMEFSAALSNYTRRKNTYFKDLVTLAEELTATASDQDTTGFDSWNVRGTYSGELEHIPASWQVGVDANIDRAVGDRIDSSGRSLGDYALFGSVRYTPIPRFTLQPGLRYAYNTSYQAPLIPSLNIKYQLGTPFTIRASYARGFRAPSLRDLYFLFVDINHNIQGNKNLQAEVSDNFNASISWKKNSTADVLELTALGFFNDIKNLITLTNVDADLYTYGNIGTYRTTGISLTGQYERERITARLGASIIGRYNALAESDDLPSFLFSPEITAGGSWKIQGVAEVSLDYKYTGKLPSYSLDENGTIQERFVDDYQMLNGSIGRTFINDRLALRLGAKNIFDVTDVTSTSGNEGVHETGGSTLPVSWGRTFFADISIAIR